MTEQTPSPDARPPGSDAPGADHLAAAARQAAVGASLDALRARLQQRLPGIELGECIGRGGMGAVFRGRQRALDRAVAIKVLLPPSGGAAEWVARFQREARALARLQHPGIVTVHDHGHSDDLAWLVMEFVDGTDLRALMEDGRLSPREALAIVPPVCEALQYAHDRGIVHRDVKPENILLDTEGRVKLVDFGLAKLSAAGEDPRLTRSDQAMGTPRYMAPEQLERPREVDHRADIFSLGVVLYEMLTGQVPAGVIEPPSRKVAVDVRLDEVVLRSLQREPERRYQSAADLQAGVKSASDAAAPVAEPRPAAVAAGPVRSGLTLADLVALLVLPTSMLVVALALRSGIDEGRSDSLQPAGWEALLQFSLLGLLWWGLPIVSAIHWLLGRRRDHAIPPAMPMVRAVFALVLLLGTLALGASFGAWHALESEGSRALLGALQGSMGTAGLLAAVLGAWSRKGAHRRLIGPQLERALLGLTAVLAALAALIGVVASFSGAIPVSAARSIHGDGLAFGVQLPILAAGVVAVVVARGGALRTATFILTVGASITFLAHVLGAIRYGGWSGPLLGCLFGAVVIGLVTVAGTAEPMTRAGGPRGARSRSTGPAGSRLEADARRGRAPTLLLGLVTLLPAASLVASVVQVLAAFGETAAAQGAAGPETLSRGLSSALRPAVIGSIVLLPLVLFYVRHAVRRAQLETETARLVWVVLLIFVAPLSMPVYWYAHLWAPLPSSQPRSGA